MLHGAFALTLVARLRDLHNLVAVAGVRARNVLVETAVELPSRPSSPPRCRAARPMIASRPTTMTPATMSVTVLRLLPVAGTHPRPPSLDNDSITFGGLLAEALTANFVNAHIPFSTTPVVPMEDRPVSVRQPGSGRCVPAPPRVAARRRSLCPRSAHVGPWIACYGKRWRTE
jgi:hypothetical protein